MRMAVLAAIVEFVTRNIREFWLLVIGSPIGYTESFIFWNLHHIEERHRPGFCC